MSSRAWVLEMLYLSWKDTWLHAPSESPGACLSINYSDKDAVEGFIIETGRASAVRRFHTSCIMWSLGAVGFDHHVRACFLEGSLCFWVLFFFFGFFLVCVVMAKHGGSCVHFSGISTCGRTSRETVSHPQCPPLPTLCKISLPIYVIVKNKLLQPLTTTWYDSLVLSISLLKI